jgi:LPXTG-motif cell wall-anchored protein
MTFDNCTEAYAAGRANIPQGDPAYSKKLDRDNDGIACDNPPAGFKPAQQTQTGTQVGGPTELPKTGPGAELGVAGGALLLVGIAAALLVRRRRTRFAA